MEYSLPIFFVITGAERITLDARTSDAIALALRFNCPIYTTDEIVEKAGIVLDFEKGTEFEHPGCFPGGRG